MSFDVSAQLMCEIDLVIANAKSQVKQSVNTAMVQAYWQIGRLIVEQEAKEKTSREYGKAQLKQLSQKLTLAHGKGLLAQA